MIYGGIDMNENKNIPLATEIIRTLKKIIFALIILEFLTIAGFMWYISLPAEQLQIENEEGNANYVGNDLNGVINNGENSSEETSSEK